MKDGIPAGTGNSRYLRSVSNFLTLYPTYSDFASALVAGTLPIDLNGINTSGWTQVGTAFTKANILTDAVATAIESFTGETLPADPMINDVFDAIAKTAIPAMTVETYSGTGTYGSGNANSIAFPAMPKLWGIFCKSASGNYEPLPNIFAPDITASNFEMYYASSPDRAWNNMSWSGNTVSWYNASAAANQLNTSGSTYYYFYIT